MKRYRVTRKGRVLAAIEEALEASGIEIVRRPDPNLAPFEYTVLMPDGQLVELVCYAFLANKYNQKGRPEDENRFQIKYGSDFDSYHRLFIDPQGRKVTLFFGVHVTEGVFVAVDPAAHNPTWFSKSVEFKDSHIRKIRRRGWAGWERDRVPGGRRKQVMPLESFTTEALLGFTPKHFGRYITFERVATGLDSTERLGLLENFGPRVIPSEGGITHALEHAFGLSAREILGVIARNNRVLMNVRGGIAEFHLERLLRSIPKLTRVVHIDKDGYPDFSVSYRGQDFRVECKNILRGSKKRPKVDFQRTRAPQGNPCGRYYSPQEFEVLAACMEPHSGRWDFKFRATSALNRHNSCPGRLATAVYVEEGWHEDPLRVLDTLL